MRTVYLSYLTVVGSTLGFVLHRDPDTYRYIPESIRRYPGAPAVCSIMREVGFEACEYIPVLGGLMAIHRAATLTVGQSRAGAPLQSRDGGRRPPGRVKARSRGHCSTRSARTRPWHSFSVEDAPASREDSAFSFISNEIFVGFTRRDARPCRWRPWPRRSSASARSGRPTTPTTTMLQYLRVERVVPRVPDARRQGDRDGQRSTQLQGRRRRLRKRAGLCSLRPRCVHFGFSEG